MADDLPPVPAATEPDPEPEPAAAEPEAQSQTAPGFEGYVEWAQETLGVQAPVALSINETPARGRGVVPATAIESDEVVLAVPFDALMTVLYAQECPTLSQLVASGLPWREDDLLAVMLIFEKHVKGAESKWSRHLELLPESYDNVLYFDGLALEAIRGSNLYPLTRQLQEQVRTDFGMVFPPLFAAYGHLGFSPEVFTLERYTWALSTVWSRFVSIQRGEQLLKAGAVVFDMFNSSPTSEVHHAFSEDSDTLYIATMQDIPAGEELFINYGRLANARLLLLYGFVLEANPFDAVELWATMSPQAPDYAIKNQLLQAHGVPHDSEPFLLTMGPLPPGLLACIRVQRLTDADLPRAEHAFEEGGMLSVDNERLTLQALVEAVQGMLDGYATTADEDDEMLELWRVNRGEILVPSDHERMAVILRRGEKRILEHNLAQLMDRLGALPPPESGVEASEASEEEAAGAEAAAEAAAEEEEGKGAEETD